jgi:hypothetical protein
MGPDFPPPDKPDGIGRHFKTQCYGWCRTRRSKYGSGIYVGQLVMPVALSTQSAVDLVAHSAASEMFPCATGANVSNSLPRNAVADRQFPVAFTNSVQDRENIPRHQLSFVAVSLDFLHAISRAEYPLRLHLGCRAKHWAAAIPAPANNASSSPAAVQIHPPTLCGKRMPRCFDFCAAVLLHNREPVWVLMNANRGL